jgi:hypothetical protein
MNKRIVELRTFTSFQDATEPVRAPIHVVRRLSGVEEASFSGKESHASICRFLATNRLLSLLLSLSPLQHDAPGVRCVDLPRRRHESETSRSRRPGDRAVSRINFSSLEFRPTPLPPLFVFLLLHFVDIDIEVAPLALIKIEPVELDEPGANRAVQCQSPFQAGRHKTDGKE